MNRPLWRWALFCAVDWLTLRLDWPWLFRLWAWCILPEWVGDADGAASTGDGDPPW